MKIVISLALLIVVGCAKPPVKPQAALAPARQGASLPACPAGYAPSGTGDGLAAKDDGNGFIMVHYTAGGKVKHTICTQADGKPDPRINKPQTIPESK